LPQLKPPPNPAPAAPVDRLRLLRRVIGILIALITFAAFIPALSAGFSDFDDPGMLLEVTGWRGLAPANLAWMFTTTNMGHYEPLTYLSYAIDFTLWGIDDAFGYHLTSVIVHAVNAVLVYVLAMRLLSAARLRRPRAQARPAASPPPDWPTILGAAVAALLWSVHPLRVESVAWITERRDVLSGCFLLLASLAYLRAFPPASIRPKSPRAYWASVVLLLISLLCKAWGMTFFVVLLILDLYPLGRMPASPPWHWLRREIRPILWQKAPFAFLGVLFAAIAASAQGSVLATVRSLSQWGIMERLSQGAYGLMFYVWKTLIPTSLAALYEVPVRLSATEPRIVIAFACVAVAVVVAIMLRRRAPGLLAAVAVYTVVVAPVLGILQSGIQFVADRYSYLSTISIAVALGAAAASVARPRTDAKARPILRTPPALILCIAAAACIAGLVTLTIRQTLLWYDGETLFAHVLVTGWDGPITRNSYGRKLEEKSKKPGCPNPLELKQRAAEQYRIAISLNPDDGQAWYALGNVERDMGHVPEAQRAYSEAVKTMPEPWSGYVALGLIDMTRTNDPKHALEMFRAAVADVERPDRPRGSTPGGGGLPYLLLAAALDMNGDPRASREMLLKAAKFEPVRQRALERLAEVEAEMREQR
jgi:hypothetical protein